MRQLTEAEVVAHLPSPKEAVELMHDCLLALADGTASVTPKSQVNFGAPENYSFANAMPAAWPKRNLLGIKWITVAPANSQKKLPTIDGSILLNDGTTGQARALLPAADITGLRTAAVTGAALALDKRPVTFLGTGVQARSHAQVLAALGYDELTVWGRREAALAELEDWASKHTPALRLRTTTNRRKALSGAGVLISGISFGAEGQLLDASDFDSGALAEDATLLPLDYGTVVGSELARLAKAQGGFAADDPEQFNSLRSSKFDEKYPATNVATGHLLRKGRGKGLHVIQNLGSGLADIVIADAVLRRMVAA